MQSKPLRRRVSRYIDVLMTQMAASAACVRFHLIGPRLARWLLMTHDRARSDGFRVTHEFLSYMLGVRRVGVTTAALELQRRGLIEYHRGELKVLDRRGLEAAACSCYASDHDAYAQLIA
jgi:CRP-like cAMP-binding protein